MKVFYTLLLALFISGSAWAQIYNVTVSTNLTVIAPDMFKKDATSWTPTTHTTGSYVETLSGKIYWTPSGGLGYANPDYLDYASNIEILDITAAGTTNVIDQYQLYGVWNRRPAYDTSVEDDTGLRLGYDGDRWVVMSRETDVVYYQNTSGSSTPPITGWKKVSGIDPAPTIVITHTGPQWIRLGKARKSLIISADESTKTYMASKVPAEVSKGVTLDVLRPWIERAGDNNEHTAIVSSGTATLTIEMR